MHCVLCSVPLEGTNQAGLICTNCKERRLQSKKTKEKHIKVRYCYRCGQRFQPSGNAVEHTLTIGGICSAG